MDNVKLMDTTPLSTTMVLLIAHLLFKFCRSHICPRLGNKSNFTCQDVFIVDLLMTGKSFNLSSLILQKMLGTLDNSTTSLPYGIRMDFKRLPLISRL